MPSVTPIGSEILVNQNVSGSQSAPSATVLVDGHYVVSWTNADRTIWMRILDASGVPAGPDIRVSTATETYASSVTALSGGGFVVSWTDNNGPTRTDVRAQIFTSTGMPVGAEFAINATAAGSQTNVDLAALADGGFVATWSSFGAGGNLDGIFVQRFAADGSRAGAEFKVDALGSDGSSPSIAVLSGGGFAIAWHDFEATARNVYVRIFDGGGQAVGAVIPVAPTISGFHYDPQIAALPDNGFVIVWKNASAPGAPGNLIRVDGQWFAAGGSNPGAVFTANDIPTLFDPQGMTVQGFGDGRFLIIWPDYSGATGDNSDGAIVGQMFGSLGERIDVNFRINSQTVHGQFDGTITALSNGSFLVGWTDQGADLGVEVRAQLFGLGLRQLFDSAGNVIDFNQVNTGSFVGPFNHAGGGDDEVVLPDNSAVVAVLMAGGFFGDAGNDRLIEGLAMLPLFGGDGDDVLTGNSSHDVLVGEAGNDRLIGRGGGDELIGGAGDDIYEIVAVGDTLVENVAEGVDSVRTSLGIYALRDNLENLIFTGVGGFIGVGNGSDNLIAGGNGAASELIGGGGNDRYAIAFAGDTIVEAAGGGIDTVETGLSAYALSEHLENLMFVGTGRFSGTGNAADNILAGGTGAASELSGGGGNDIYRLSVIGDTIVEHAGGGIDMVETQLTLYALGAANVENLTFTGTGNFTGIGNALDNRIAGGAGADYLYAGAGADILIGGAGADNFLFDGAVEGVDAIVDFVSQTDRIFLNRSVFAGAGPFSLVQGSGALSAASTNMTIFYHADSGQLGFDADGSGPVAEIIFATLSPGLVLAIGDFLFY